MRWGGDTIQLAPAFVVTEEQIDSLINAVGEALHELPDTFVGAEPAYLGHYINGEEVPDRSRTQDVFNPATGEVTLKVGLASQSIVSDAVNAAAAAFPAWRRPRRKNARKFCSATNSCFRITQKISAS